VWTRIIHEKTWEKTYTRANETYNRAKETHQRAIETYQRAKETHKRAIQELHACVCPLCTKDMQNTHTHARMHERTHIQTYTNTYTHTRIHTHTHTRIHTHTRSQRCLHNVRNTRAHTDIDTDTDTDTDTSTDTGTDTDTDTDTDTATDACTTYETHTYRHTHTLTLTYTHTHINIYTHAHTTPKKNASRTERLSFVGLQKNDIFLCGTISWAYWKTLMGLFFFCASIVWEFWLNLKILSTCNTIWLEALSSALIEQNRAALIVLKESVLWVFFLCGTILWAYWKILFNWIFFFVGLFCGSLFSRGALLRSDRAEESGSDRTERFSGAGLLCLWDYLSLSFSLCWLNRESTQQRDNSTERKRDRDREKERQRQIRWKSTTQQRECSLCWVYIAFDVNTSLLMCIHLFWCNSLCWTLSVESSSSTWFV